MTTTAPITEPPAARSPLSGVLVTDLSRVLAGPLVAMTLGDLGANVIKVEHPTGDETRSWMPPVDDLGRSTYHHAVNRNKRSIALDIKDPSDLRLVRRLCERSDVVVSNFRPGVLERHGLGYEVISANNGRVVYCEISGFGDGAGAALPGYDPLVQALGGLMSITGPPGQPSKTGVALVDVIAGLYASTAVVAALRERDGSGTGQRLTINLMHVALAALSNQATSWLGAGTVPTSTGNAHPSIEPFGTYRAADGDLMLCIGNDNQFRAFASEIGAPKLAEDSSFATNQARTGSRERLRKEIEDRLAVATCAEWAKRLLNVGVAAGPIQSIPKAFEFAESIGLNAVEEVDGVRTVAFPVQLSRTPSKMRLRPPDLNQHGEELRAWLEA